MTTFSADFCHDQYGIYCNSASLSNRILIRSGLGKNIAENLANEMNRCLNQKVTKASCSCGGIGGCYLCDS